jgi:hypothetical protein
MAKLEIEISADNKKLKSGLADTDRQLQKTGQSFGKLNEFAVGALSGIAAAFSVAAIVDFGKAVLETTAKFQKFEAVLSNTLGSESQAQLALSQINKFASQTPFAVDELTSSFVNLANQGFKPTVNELTSLGDLASSTGKSFDQLAEAIIDAQVGEFERLKEFGIRAKKEGENVTFTFKGVETQVKNTEKEIRSYLLSLGDAQGVSGSMAKISETLGGKISNLGDNLEQLKLTIGNSSSGVFATSIDWLNTFIKQATLAVKGVSEIKDEVKKINFGEGLQSTFNEIDELIPKLQKIFPELSNTQIVEKAINNISESYRNLSDTALKNGNLTVGQLQKILKEIDAYGEKLKGLAAQAEPAKETFEAFAKIAELKNEAVFSQWDQEAKAYNDTIKESLRLSSLIAEVSSTIPVGGGSGVQNINVGLPSEAPIVETADVFAGALEKIKIKVDDLGMAFNGLGSLIGKAFKNPQFGSFLSQFAQFVAKVIAGALAVSKANAVAGATQSSLFTGPAAAFTLPAFITGALGLVASAFSGIGGGGGGGNSGVGSGAQSQSFTGSAAFIDPSSMFSNVTFEIAGDKLIGVIDRTQDRYAKG